MKYTKAITDAAKAALDAQLALAVAKAERDKAYKVYTEAAELYSRTSGHYTKMCLELDQAVVAELNK